MVRYRSIWASWVLFCFFNPTAWAQSPAPLHYILTGPDPQALKEEVQAAGGTIVSTLRYHSGYVVEMNTEQARAMKSLLLLRQTVRGTGLRIRAEEPEIFEQDKAIVAIDSLSPTHPAIISDDPTLSSQQKTPWGIETIHAREAHAITQGRGVTVCVIDSGVQADHPDLEGAVVGGENTLSTNPNYANAQDFDDDYGHGTHVSGTIAARDNGFGVVGVAPLAKLYEVKALDYHGAGSFSSLAEGIRACMAHGAQVINMSLAFVDHVETIERAVHDAVDAGIVLVAASGNSKGPVEYPARLPGVVAVSSIGTDQSFSYFSNRGPEISFAAPGEMILSTYPHSQYAIMEGTSQATPHVAGVAALLISAGMRDVARHLQGEDLGLPQEQQGQGRIDALKSLHGD